MDAGIVTDNSVVMAWCFEDEACEYADSVLEALQYSRAVVPAVWPLEVGNVLAAAERRGRLKAADCVRFLELLSNLPLDVRQESPARQMSVIYRLARDTGLSTYDASYLDLSMRTGFPLASMDKALITAARSFDVEIFGEMENG